MSPDHAQPHEPTDEQLLAEHLAGQPGRFDLLVQRHHRELYLFLARFTGDMATAEDLVQETFLQVHLAGEGFDTDRRFRPWLFAIAANKARDRMRYRSRRPEMPLDAEVGSGAGQGIRFVDLLPDDGEDPSGEVAQAEQRRMVREIIDGMPPHLKELLILGYFHQIPYKEIAESLDIPLGTVKSRLHGAVRHFAAAWRERLGESMEPGEPG